ncbi:MAG: hypothetical protein ACFFBD_15440 [Candidatus Hodarchaeota archaeon]
MQKAIIVSTWVGPGGVQLSSGLEELNKYLTEGWKVVSNAPMSAGSAYRHCSLIIIEQ